MISFTLLRASQMFKASYGGLQAGGDRDRQSVGFRLDDVLSERGTVSCTAGRLIGHLSVRPELCSRSQTHGFFPGGTRRFSSSNQFSTTLICVGAAASSSLSLWESL
jgi:hypothetical protein